MNLTKTDGDVAFMILIGTDGGMYRWFEGTPWPIFHSLQGMKIVAAASRPGGLLVAAAESGAFLESRDNGLNWTNVPPPAWNGGASAMLLLGVNKPIAVLATKSAGLFRRYIGGEGWSPLANPSSTKKRKPAHSRSRRDSRAFADRLCRGQPRRTLEKSRRRSILVCLPRPSSRSQRDPIGRSDQHPCRLKRRTLE